MSSLLDTKDIIIDLKGNVQGVKLSDTSPISLLAFECFLSALDDGMSEEIKNSVQSKLGDILGKCAKKIDAASLRIKAKFDLESQQLEYEFIFSHKTEA